VVESSRVMNVPSGAPQGSVLGPLLLFLVYIDDVTELLLNEGSALNLYADDMLLYRPIKSLDDYTKLQEDIDRIYVWSVENNLSFNTSKCKAMLVSRKRVPTSPPCLFVNHAPLEFVTTYKYLGVLLMANLSWSAHITSICGKARKLIGLLYRRFYANTCPESLLVLYTSQVRPHLEYAAQVWDPHLQKDIDALENVQKFALRMCTKCWSTNYQELLLATSMPTLQDRRSYLKLCSLHKIANGFIYFPQGLIIHKQSRCGLNESMLSQPFARTNSSLYSFIPSSIRLWNNLPKEARLSSSVHVFKLYVAPLFLFP